jgi:hypothetical protein
MKKWIIITGIILALLLAGSVSGAAIDDKVYSALAPCYSDWLIKSYGPVPVFDKDHTVISRGVATGFTGFVDRDAWYKKLNRLYEKTKVPVDEKFSYPRGPVIAYGYDALGSMTIGLDEKQDVKQETIDSIYSYVNTVAKEEGIENLPVIFYSTPVPKLDLGRTDIWRPIIGGVQTGSPVGTLTVGFAASRGGQNGFITAGHIGSVGTTVYQPNTAYPIGTVTVSSLGTSSDSAWVQYSNTAGQVFESSGSLPWVSGSTDPYLNLGIAKSGISTDVTTGTVVSQTSLYNSFFAKTLYNQWYGSYSSASGDSGSPVYFKDANQQIQIVGIHWAMARYSTFSPVSSVLSDLA